VKLSGTVSVTRKLFLIGKDELLCKSNTTETERGFIRWPKSLSGTYIQTSCPFGSLNNGFASRKCSKEGQWSDMKVSECLFNDKSTKDLQKLYAVSVDKDNIHSGIVF